MGLTCVSTAPNSFLGGFISLTTPAGTCSVLFDVATEARCAQRWPGIPVPHPCPSRLCSPCRRGMRPRVAFLSEAPKLLPGPRPHFGNRQLAIPLLYNFCRLDVKPNFPKSGHYILHFLEQICPNVEQDNDQHQQGVGRASHNPDCAFVRTRCTPASGNHPPALRGRTRGLWPQLSWRTRSVCTPALSLVPSLADSYSKPPWSYVFVFEIQFPKWIH